MNSKKLVLLIVLAFTFYFAQNIQAVETKDNKYSLHWRFLLQSQYKFINAENEDDTNTFLIIRAQIRLFGHVLDPGLTYKFMLMGASSTSGEGDINLRDAWIN
jgi:hypothetical protein